MSCERLRKRASRARQAEQVLAEEHWAQERAKMRANEVARLASIEHRRRVRAEQGSWEDKYRELLSRRKKKAAQK